MLRWTGRTADLGERGTTLLEVMITATLTMVVLGAVLGVFDTFLRAESGFERRADENSDLQAATAEFARDARSAGAPWPGNTSPQMLTSLTMPRVAADGAPEVVQWTIGGSGTLDRTVVKGESEGDERQLLSDLDTDASKLTYFAADGTELVPGRDPASTIAGCAVRVEMRLVSTSGDVDARASARLRNATAEDPC